MFTDEKFLIGLAVGVVATIVLIGGDDEEENETKVENPRRQLNHAHWDLAIFPAYRDAEF